MFEGNIFSSNVVFEIHANMFNLESKKVDFGEFEFFKQVGIELLWTIFSMFKYRLDFHFS